MRIFLDGKPLSYQLEGERTLGELVSAFNEWLKERKGVITEIKVDGKSVSLDVCLKSEKRLEQIEDIHFFTQSIVEFVASSAFKAHEEMEEVFLKERVQWKKVEELMKNLVNVKDGTKQLKNAFSLDLSRIRINEMTAEEVLCELDDVLRLLQICLERRKRGEFLQLQDKIKECVQKALLLITNVLKALQGVTLQTAKTIQRALRESASQIDELCKDLEKIASMLQKGEMQKALEKLSETIWSIEGIMQAVENAREAFSLDYNTIVFGSASLADRIMELKGLLSELINAFENKDYIMLADLLEYELAPSLRGWKEPLSAMLKRIKEAEN